MAHAKRATLKASSGAWGVKGGIRGASLPIQAPLSPLERTLSQAKLESSNNAKKVDSSAIAKAIQPQSSLRVDEIGVAIHSLIFHRDPTTLTQPQKSQILSALSTLKVLDPACGSGAFPIGLLQELLELGEILGDTRDAYTRKLEILQNNIYGIDIQPMATEISRLRCFLSLIVDEAKDFIAPLPNLEFKFLSANSLLPLPQDSTLEYDGYQADKQKLESIRQDNFSADLSKRESLKQSYLKTATHIARNLILHAQGESPLTSWNPYDPHSVAGFFDSEYMFGLSGFDIVIGNPPYIDYRKIDKETKEALSKNSKVYKENKEGSIFVYFIEKAADLMNPKGNSVFINPISYIIADSGSGIRNFIDTHLNLIKLIDVSNFKVFKSASAYTCINHFIHNTNKDKFIEFARIDDTTQLDFMPLIKIPKVKVESISTKLDNIVDKINNINTNLSNYCDIFCGLSVAGFRKDVSNSKNEINVPFLESKDIYRYQFTSGKYLAKPQTYYSKEKLKIFQQAEIIFMARMTNFIRCCIAPMGFFGGKVNVLHNFKVNKLVILGILNSKLMSHFYAKKYFALHMQGGAFGFDTTSIKNLPIPQIDSTTEARFVKIVQEILESKKQGKDTQELESKIDSLVYKLYNLSDDEITTIDSKT